MMQLRYEVEGEEDDDDIYISRLCWDDDVREKLSKSWSGAKSSKELECWKKIFRGKVLEKIFRGKVLEKNFSRQSVGKIFRGKVLEKNFEAKCWKNFSRQSVGKMWSRRKHTARCKAGSVEKTAQLEHWQCVAIKSSKGCRLCWGGRRAEKWQKRRSSTRRWREGVLRRACYMYAIAAITARIKIGSWAYADWSLAGYMFG